MSTPFFLPSLIHLNIICLHLACVCTLAVISEKSYHRIRWITLLRYLSLSVERSRRVILLQKSNSALGSSSSILLSLKASLVKNDVWQKYLCLSQLLDFFFLYYAQPDLYSNSQGGILALPGFILSKMQISISAFLLLLWFELGYCGTSGSLTQIHPVPQCTPSCRPIQAGRSVTLVCALLLSWKNTTCFPPEAQTLFFQNKT